MAVVPKFGGDEDFLAGNAALLDGAADSGLSTIAVDLLILVGG